MSERKPHPLATLDLPPVWLAGFIAVAWAQARWLPWGKGGTGADWAGNGLIAMGLVIMALAVIQMFTHRTTLIPKQRPSRLLTNGAFGISRNPIYLGDTLVLFGLILRWDAFLTLALVPVFMAVIHRRFILGEEQQNRREFGEAFETYTTKVRRWL